MVGCVSVLFGSLAEAQSFDVTFESLLNEMTDRTTICRSMEIPDGFDAFLRTLWSNTAEQCHPEFTISYEKATNVNGTDLCGHFPPQSRLPVWRTCLIRFIFRESKKSITFGHPSTPDNADVDE
jgi:hypothetical protein